MTGGYVVCGSRDWPAPWFVTAKMIELIPDGALVITGGARRRRDLPPDRCSVDEHANKEAIRLGHRVLVIPADWDAEPRRAGFIRNIKMLETGPVAVLAFQYNRSQGTAHTIRETYKRGITLHHFTEKDLRPDIGALDSDYEPITP